MYSVYRLLDPRDLQIRYVGISKNAQQRFHEHCQTNGNNPDKDAWIKELKELSFAPILEVLATGLTCKEAQDQERELIHHYYHKLGFPLTNRDGVKRKAPNRGMTGGIKKYYGVSPVREIQIIPVPPRGVRVKELLTHEDVARILRISEYTARQMCKSGTIKSKKIGRNWRVKQEDLQSYIDNLPEEGKK